MARKQFQTLSEPMYYVLLSLTEECCGVDIMKKVEISMPCKLMLARRSFFCLAAQTGQKEQSKLDELGFLLAYPLRIFVVGLFCCAAFRSRMGARTHAADEEEQAISEGSAE